MISEEAIIEAWCHALSTFYRLARGERLGEFMERRSRLIDDRGLHPLSLEVGRIMALQDLYPLLEELGFNHLDVRKAAQQDAAHQYEVETAVEVGLRNRWITEAQGHAILMSHDGGDSKWKNQARGRGAGNSRR
jgi:hypothetical protein